MLSYFDEYSIEMMNIFITIAKKVTAGPPYFGRFRIKVECTAANFLAVLLRKMEGTKISDKQNN